MDSRSNGSPSITISWDGSSASMRVRQGLGSQPEIAISTLTAVSRRRARSPDRRAKAAAEAPNGRLGLVRAPRMHAGEWRVGADFSPDRGEFGQTNRRVDRVGGARPGAAQLDHREPDRANVDADDKASRLGSRIGEHRRLRQRPMRARYE